MEGQPICLKLGKFAASRADHERGPVGLHRQGARGHGEFIIVSKMVKSHVRLGWQTVSTSQLAPSSMDTWVGLKSNLHGPRIAGFYLHDGHAVLTPLQRPSEQGRVEQIIGAPPSKIRLGSLASFFTGAKLLNQHLVLLG